MAIESLTTVVILSVLVEMVTNIIKSIFPIIKINNMSAIMAALIGISLCLGTGIGILDSLNIDITFKTLDYLMTGIIVSRGSNVVHDMLTKFKNNIK